MNHSYVLDNLSNLVVAPCHGKDNAWERLVLTADEADSDQRTCSPWKYGQFALMRRMLLA